MGRHDWTAFSAAQNEAEKIASPYAQPAGNADPMTQNGRPIAGSDPASANGFLRYMVVRFAGTLLAAGRREMDLDTVTKALTTGDRRTIVGPTAASQRTTLLEVVIDQPHTGWLKRGQKK